VLDARSPPVADDDADFSKFELNGTIDFDAIVPTLRLVATSLLGIAFEKYSKFEPDDVRDFSKLEPKDFDLVQPTLRSTVTWWLDIDAGDFSKLEDISDVDLMMRPKRRPFAFCWLGRCDP
jgi:hypothetical protein